MGCETHVGVRHQSCERLATVCNTADYLDQGHTSLIIF